MSALFDDPVARGRAHALSAPCWRRRRLAVEEIVAAEDVRFEGRLWLLARFHLAPAELRRAAREGHQRLSAVRCRRAGRLSEPPPGAGGHLSPHPGGDRHRATEARPRSSLSRVRGLA